MAYRKCYSLTAPNGFGFNLRRLRALRDATRPAKRRQVQTRVRQNIILATVLPSLHLARISVQDGARGIGWRRSAQLVPQLPKKSPIVSGTPWLRKMPYAVVT
jgi:hypothetical protein